MPDEEAPKVLKARYPSNSHKAKDIEEPEKAKVDKVISGEVVERKKPLGKRFLDGFKGDDTRSVGEYILFEVAIPAIKELIFDMASQGLQRTMFGDSRAGRNIAQTGVRAYNAYNRVGIGQGSTRSNLDRPGGQRQMSQQARATHNFNEIVLDNRGDAEAVIDRLIQLIDAFGQATVTDLYDCVGITGSFTDDKYGWYAAEFAGARVHPVRGGFLLDLPQTTVIE